MQRWHRKGNFFSPKLTSWIKAKTRRTDVYTPWGVSDDDAANLKSCWRNVQFCYTGLSPINSIFVISKKKPHFATGTPTTVLRLYVHERITQPAFVLAEAIDTIYSTKQAYMAGVKIQPLSYCGFPFDNQHDLDLILRLFKLINKKYDQTIFTKELFSDLQKMMNCIQIDMSYCKETFSKKPLPAEFFHQIPKFNKPTICFSRHCNRLFDLLYQKIKDFNGSHSNLFSETKEKSLEACLTSGIDVNELDNNGIPPLFLALWENRGDRVISLLLRYGANPFDRGHMEFMHLSPYELAVQGAGRFPLLYLNMLKNMVSSTFKPLKSLPSTVSHATIDRKNTNICSEFHLNNGEIIKSEIKPTTQLSLDEIVYFVEFSKRFFKKKDDPHQEKINSAMIEEVALPNRLIETLKNKQNQIIGYKTYQLIHYPNDPTLVSVYDSLSVLLPEYRDYGIMPILAARILFSLQLLLKDHNIALFSLDVSYKSFSMVENDYNFPVYQPPHVVALMDYLIRHILGVSVNPTTDKPYTHDGVTVYIEDQIAVTGGNESQRHASLNENHFNREILRWHDPTTPHFRAVPKLIFVSDLNFMSIHHHCLKLGIKLMNHIIQLAHAFLPYLRENFNHYPYQLSPSATAFKDAKALFFSRKRVESQKAGIVSQIKAEL